jgi:RHS repeat-associated protein
MRHYIGNFVYSGTSTLKFIMTDEGRLVPNGSNYDSEYFIKDHLGNTRVVVKDNNGTAKVQQESHYYPFGMTMEGMSYSGLLSGVEANKYLYNGKELQDDLGLNWYDYGARFYDATLARWSVLDPKADKYYSFSPYNYCLNTPLILVDPDGQDVKPTNAFANDKNTSAGMNLFLKSNVAKRLLSKFSSGNDLIKQSSAGSLSRHDIVFDKSSGGAHGTSQLFYVNSEDKTVPYEKGSQLSGSEKFEIKVTVASGLIKNDKEVGFAATTINHEVFAHTENTLNLIEAYQNGDISLDEFQQGLDALTTEEQGDNEHNQLYSGNNANYETTHEEMLNHVTNEENKATTKEERKKHRNVRKGLNEGYEGQ